MTRRLLTGPTWRRILDRLGGPWSTDDPDPQPSRLDRLDGIGTDQPAGEVPPAHTQASLAALTRIDHDLRRMCQVCDYIPEDPALAVITHHPNGTHVVADNRDRTALALPTRPVTTVYDQDTPLASEVEAWLAGGAR